MDQINKSTYSNQFYSMEEATFSLTNGNWNLSYCTSRINSIIQIAICSKTSF
jgi:hypothetical protein